MRDPRDANLRHPGLSLLAVLLFVACEAKVEHRPNVVLIVVDTLRADRLPFHGGDPRRAPFLDELARRSIVFESAWSPSSWTLPSTVSIFTSVHPFQHGVGNLDGLELGPGDDPVPVRCIPDEVETLAETLRAVGYRTFGIASNILIGSEVGFDRGFDRFVRLEDEDADAVNAVAGLWREDVLAEEPYFLYLHYIDPHDTFHAREPWFELAMRGGEHPWPEGTPSENPDARGDLDWMLTRLDPGPDWLGGRKSAELAPEELDRLMAWMRAAYDSEIGFVDARVRAIYELFGLEDAVLLFLADHGEEFYEHGDLTHGQNLYGETVRVPFLLKLPDGTGAQPRRISTHVTTLDVVPTLRGLLGLPPSEQDQGRDLLAARSLGNRPIVSFLQGKSGQHPLDEDLRSLVLGDHRLIVLGDGEAELYDITVDPLERRDLADERPAVVARMREELEEIERTARRYERLERIPGPPSEAMLEHLQGIGYLGDE